jgi:hypothetical protein
MKMRYITMGFYAAFATMGPAIAAESWTLWMKTELFALESTGEKLHVGTFWKPAGKTKESSSFNSKTECESQRNSTIAKIRSLQGTKDVTDKERTTIRVQGETIIWISQFKDGKVEQNMEFQCRYQDPPKDSSPGR